MNQIVVWCRKMIDKRFGFISNRDDHEVTEATEEIPSYDNYRPSFAVDIDRGLSSPARSDPSKKSRSMRGLIVLGILSLILLATASSLSTSDVPIGILTLEFDNSNVFIGPGIGKFGSLASDPENWNLGHVPIQGEDVLFDGRSGKCYWNIDVWIHDFTVLPNFTGGAGNAAIFIRNSHFHISGNFTLLASSFNFIGYLDDNVVIEGWTHIAGNNSNFISTIYSNYGNTFYFNGSVDIEWHNFGLIQFTNSIVVCNSTFRIDGTTMPLDFISYDVMVFWDDDTYFEFKKDATFDGIHNILAGGGYAHENITFRNITDYLLIDNNIPGTGFTFAQRPQFVNITKCSTCGYTPNFNIEYEGELGFAMWEGWMTDFINVLNINGHGTVYQSYDIQYGSLTLFPVGLLNINNGTYQVNGSYYLDVVNGMTGNPGVIGVNATFQGGSGWIYADFLNIYDGGQFYLNESSLNVRNVMNLGMFLAQNGSITTSSFDTSAGTFIAGDSTVVLNSSGTLGTDGTIAGGLNNLVIMPNVTVNLISDVYVTGSYSNLGGIVIEDGHHIYQTNESADTSRTASNWSAIDRTNAFIGSAGRLGASASDPANWNLGHVPVDGENLIFDARAGTCKWDLSGIVVNDVLIEKNCTKNLNIYLGSLHIAGNLTINGSDAGLQILYLSGGNFAVDGWTRVGDSSFIFGRGTGLDFASYFNGPVQMDFPTSGRFAWSGVSYVVFNSTVVIDGAMTPVDYFDCLPQVMWHSGAYLEFRGDVLINVTSFDSSGGAFIAGNSTLTLYSMGILKTDGTQAGGLNDLIIMPGALITLQSDVYVNGRFTNLGGTVVEGPYHLYYSENPQ